MDEDRRGILDARNEDTEAHQSMARDMDGNHTDMGTRGADIHGSIVSETAGPF